MARGKIYGTKTPLTRAGFEPATYRMLPCTPPTAPTVPEACSHLGGIYQLPMFTLGLPGLPTWLNWFTRGLHNTKKGLDMVSISYQRVYTRFVTTKPCKPRKPSANFLQRFAFSLYLVYIPTDAQHAPRDKQAKSRANSLHSKAHWRPQCPLSGSIRALIQ